MPESLTAYEVANALRELGGEANWRQLLEHVTEKRGGTSAPYRTYKIYRETLRQKIHSRCPGYAHFNGDALFEKVSLNRFRLIGFYVGSNFAGDDDQYEFAVRRSREIAEFSREARLAKQLKELYRCRCQVCGLTIELPNGDFYAEAHHIRGLGDDGPDCLSNMLCVCPNCHVLLDLKALRLSLDSLDKKHHIGREYIERHNELFEIRWK